MINNEKLNVTEVITQEKIELKKPKLFKVILLNDDYTPMEYVVNLIKIVFRKNESEAVNIMLMVHKKGSGVCGIFTKEIAETKVETVLKMAKTDQHPLKCIMEPDQ
ncbi:MAG: ATP-dependent Clp protease adapter ClpS [Alphaproteobacteria bacterium]|tara:strand:+ start:16 stop:333 length:318 start_codon:yes stop_codon:yes gene_type:complete